MFLMFLTLAAAAAAPSETDLAGHLRDGELLCVKPDEANKSCDTIDRVTVNPDGTMIETSETLFSDEPPTAVELTNPVSVEGDAVCAVVDMAALRQGIVRVNGTPLPPDANAALIRTLGEILKPAEGHTICERLQIDAGQLVVTARDNGTPSPYAARPVRWISAGAGWRVALPSHKPAS